MLSTALFFLGCFLGSAAARVFFRDRAASRIVKLKEELDTAYYQKTLLATQLSHIKMTVDLTKGRGHDGSPYRGVESGYLVAIDKIDNIVSKSFESVPGEVGCFNSLEKAEEFIDKWEQMEAPYLKENYCAPLIVKNRHIDRPCWHVYLNVSPNEDMDMLKCSICTHREGWRENECGIGNPTWPDPYCPYWAAHKPEKIPTVKKQEIS